MKALCPETGSIPFSLRPWMPWFGETTVRYAEGAKEAKAVCRVTHCNVQSCTRKIYVSTGTDFITVLARRASTGQLKIEQKAAAEAEQLEADVIEIMKDRGML